MKIFDVTLEQSAIVMADIGCFKVTPEGVMYLYTDYWVDAGSVFHWIDEDEDDYYNTEDMDAIRQAGLAKFK